MQFCDGFRIRFVFVFLYILFQVNSLSAQSFSLTGRVVDTENKPLAGASILLVNSGQSVLTGANGFFTFKSNKVISAKELELQISYIGKRTQNLKYKNNSELNIPDIKLEDISLALDEVTILPAKGQKSNSSLVFDREMIERYPALSLGDLLNRLPNRANSAPSVQNLQNLTLRGSFQKTTGSSRNVQEMNNSFGVAIIVDDIAMSNNGNMQSRNASIHGMGSAFNAIRPSDYGLTGRPATNESYSGENPFAGVDLRQIPVENIESIEVISGVAPVRYGDISNGAVIIETQAGKTPAFFKMQLRNNATNYSFSKGFSLGEKLGALNINVGYVNSFADNRDKLKQYRRINSSLAWTNHYGTNRKIKQTFSVNYNKILDRVNKDPDDPMANAISFGGYSWNASSRTSFKIDGSFLKNIQFNLGFSEAIQTTYREHSNNLPYVLYTDAIETGIVEGKYSEGIFTSVDHVEGRPISGNARLEFNAVVYTGAVVHQLNFGSNYTYDFNIGRGRIVDPSRPKRDLGGTKSDRYYNFSMLKPIHNIGLYAEDAFNLDVGDKNLAVRAGIRWDSQNGHSSFSPRTNVSMNLSEQVRVGLAYGLAFKAPGLSQLYPGPSFDDILLLNSYNGMEAESLALFYVRRHETDNSNIKSSLGQTVEGTLSWMSNGHRLQANLFWKKNDRGINTVSQRTVMMLPQYKVEPVAGQKPIVTPNGEIPYLLSNLYFANNLFTVNQGVEVMYSSPSISAINTRFSVTAALTSALDRSKAWQAESMTPGSTNPDDITIAFYNPRNARNFLSRGQLRSSTHFPKLRLVFELVADLQFLNYSKIEISDLYPKAYYTRDLNYYVIDVFDMNNPNHKLLYDHKKVQLENLNSENNLVYANFGLSIAKEIGKRIYLSFNAYNFLDYQPRYFITKTGTVVAPNSSPNYGAQITYKF